MMELRNFRGLLGLAILVGSLSFGSAYGADVVGATQTLGADSGYQLTESAVQTDDTITLYEITNKTESYSYIDENGNTIVKQYLTKATTPHYYTYQTIKPDFGTISNTSGNDYGDVANVLFTGHTSIAVSNYSGGNIGNINADVIDNSSTGNAESTISNAGVIANITGDYINNNGYSENTHTYGGAIANRSIIGDIRGNFLYNSAEGHKGGDLISAQGGAIYNNTQMGNITGDFVGNYAKGTAAVESPSRISTMGGAIANHGGDIKVIKGNFINNYVETTGNMASVGGAIASWFDTTNKGNIEGIEGNFIGNHAIADGVAGGGAIYVKYNNIGYITGDFINNYAKSENNFVSGGAIKNETSSIGDIKSNFINNWTKSENANAQGGAIYNGYSILGDIIGNFIGNRAIGNSIISRQSGGGALISGGNSIIGNITGNFIGNYAEDNNAIAGALYNTGSTIGNITGNFINNHATARVTNARGGAIYNTGTIGDIRGDFTDNYIESQGDYAAGGAIYNKGTIGSKDENGNLVGGLINSSLTGNYAKGATEAMGGAIYSSTDFNIIADNHQNVIAGNYTLANGVKDDNAIYLDSDTAKLTFNLKNNGSVVLKDNIDGKEGYMVDIKGDSINNTTFFLLNDIRNANLAFANTTINTIDNKIHVYNVNELTINSDTNIDLDMDLKNQEMDRFTANSYGTHNGNLIVNGVNIVNDSDADEIAIYFAEPGLKNNVENRLSKKDYIYSPIYRYQLRYDKDNEYRDLGDGGYFVITRSARPSSGSSSGANSQFNPAVLATPTNDIAAVQSVMNETFRYVFEHADAFTQLPEFERRTFIDQNKYASSTDFNNNLDEISKYNKAVWVRPYTTFENIPLKNGPNVDIISYGTLVGFDTDFRELKHGWLNVGTGYLGYNGAQIDYHGVDATTNGGLLGVTETFYKNNFWSAITLSAGANNSEISTMYGKDNTTSLLAGIGSKTGYNFQFKDGKFILQPILFMSYTMVKTFDYTNAAGVKINSDPSHNIQINPSIRFSMHTENHWQPYASVGMVWNVMNTSSVVANNTVKLHNMGIKPYVEYGLGVQRHWADKFTAFGEAMVRNGGRNGLALTLGMRWQLENDTFDKVCKPIKKLISKDSETKDQKPKTKTVIKSL